MSDIMPRPVVLGFAREMEAKLRANDRKGGWRYCDLRYLSYRLRRETDELVAAVQAARNGTDEQRRAIVAEAADVANFAMMIADNFGGLSHAQK